MFQSGPITALIGELGAMGKLLKMPSDPGGFFEESAVEFHSLDFDFDLGLFLSKTGAMSYIVDTQSGKIISKGYHFYFRKNGKLFGQTGAIIEEVTFIQSDQGGPDALSPAFEARIKVRELLDPAYKLIK